MPHYLGLDPSLSATGIIVLDENAKMIHKDVFTTVASGSAVPARMNRFEALVVLAKKVCEEFDPEMICIEGYSFMSNMPGSNDRIEYGGILRYALSRKWPIMEVSPMSLKKWASGSGKGDKTGVIAGITSLYGMRFQSSDEYDAYALARIALQLKNGEIPSNTPQREVIEKLWNPAVKKKKPPRDKPSRKRKPKGIA